MNKNALSDIQIEEIENRLQDISIFMSDNKTNGPQFECQMALFHQLTLNSDENVDLNICDNHNKVIF